MSENQSAEIQDAENKLDRFLEAQTQVFELHKSLLEWCQASLEGKYDQRNYDVSKHVLKDVVAFESAFEDFEIEFWNYAADVDNSRAWVDNQVLQLGLADHKEYFFAAVELARKIMHGLLNTVRALGSGMPDTFMYITPTSAAD